MKTPGRMSILGTNTPLHHSLGDWGFKKNDENYWADKYRKVPKKPEGPQPLILDLVSMKGMHRGAFKSFRFGREESHFLGKFVKDNPEMIIDNREFAIAPFPNIYIELDMTGLMEGQGHKARRGTERMGFVFESGSIINRIPHNHVSVVVEGFGKNSDQQRAGYSQYAYWQRAPRKTDNPLIGSPSEDYGLDALFLAGFYKTVSADLRRQLRQEWTVYNSQGNHPTLWTMEAALPCAGELHILLAAMLFLNRARSIIRMEDVAPRAVLHKGKRKVYMAHTNVILGPKVVVRNLPKIMQITNRESARRHEVRGHFMHYKLLDRCEHDWQPAAYGRIPFLKRWQCTKCEARRVWRSHFERGDASKGYVTKDYTMGDQSE